MGPSKDYILGEIRRLAEVSGSPPGRKRFSDRTGIRPGEWGRHWARWSDALKEAGLPPNAMQAKFDDASILESLALQTRRLGRMPTLAEWTLRRYEDPSLPTASVLQRLGSKQARARLLADFCQDRPEFADVRMLVAPLLRVPAEAASVDSGDRSQPSTSEDFGSVYMLRSGRHYKLGRTNALGRRRYELALQLPERATLVHEIRTDDPAGIEAYWHRRFADRRRNGEWFELTADDVKAFKRRRGFM